MACGHNTTPVDWMTAPMQCETTMLKHAMPRRPSNSVICPCLGPIISSLLTSLITVSRIARVDQRYRIGDSILSRPAPEGPDGRRVFVQLIQPTA